MCRRWGSQHVAHSPHSSGCWRPTSWRVLMNCALQLASSVIFRSWFSLSVQDGPSAMADLGLVGSPSVLLSPAARSGGPSH